MERLIKTLILGLIASSGIGCAPAFHARPLGSDERALSDNIVPGGSGLTKAQAQQILSHGNWSEYLPDFSGATEMEYRDITVQIPFGRILSPLAKQLNTAVPDICREAGYFDAGANYTAFEYACGTPESNEWKRLLTIDVPEQRDDDGSTHYHIPAFSTPLYLSRVNRAMYYSLESLDDKKLVGRTTSLAPGRDVAIRFRPDGNTLGIDACFYMPGASLTLPAQTLNVSGSTKVLGVRVGATTKVEVKFGELSFDGARTCATAVMDLAPDTGIPRITSSSIHEPQLIGANLSGTSIKLKDWWARWLDSILKVFGTNIRRSLINRAQNEVADLSEADSQNGQWIAKMAQKLLAQKHIDKLNGVIAQKIKDENVPTSATEIKKVLKRNCQLLSIVDSELKKFVTPEYCSSVVDSFEIHLSPFERSEASSQMGCYNNYALAHTTKDDYGNPKWWGDKCVLNARIIVGIPQTKEIKQLTAIIKKVAKYLKESELPKALAAKIKARGISVDEALKTIDQAIASGRIPRTIQDLEAMF